MNASRFVRHALLLVAVGAAGFVSCGSPQGGVLTQGGEKMTIAITSTAFKEGAAIPKRYSGDGEELSPPLSWSGVPPEAKELAIIVDDPDAPTPQPWVHWVIYKIPTIIQGLPEGMERSPAPKKPLGALQGYNSWPKSEGVGYRGPKPPPGRGPHRYNFHIYALDTALDVKPGLTKDGLLKAMQGHIIAEGQLMGTFER
jgi:Raf kinase inhibitor-like YbhB/YbcL family protein